MGFLVKAATDGTSFWTMPAKSEAAQQLRETLAERACERGNRIKPGLRASALHLNNRIFGETAVHGKVGKAPAARLAQPLDALAKPCLKGLLFSAHPYQLSGTAQIRDSITLVLILTRLCASPLIFPTLKPETTNR